MFARRSALRLARAWVLRPLEAGRGPALPPRALSFAAAQPPPRGNFGSLLPTAARSAGQVRRTQRRRDARRAPRVLRARSRRPRLWAQSATRLLHVASPDQQPGARSAATAECVRACCRRALSRARRPSPPPGLL